MKPADVAGLIDVGYPRLSPDGSAVAFVVTTVDMEANDYRSRVWLADVSGESPPRPFTKGDGQDHFPRWSPDGRFLAFTAKNEADDVIELRVIPVTVGGEVRTVATSKEDVTELEWSPDGTRLAYITRVRDKRYDEKKAKDQPARRITRFFWKLDSVGWTFDRPSKVFVVDVERDSPPVQLTFGDVDDSGLSWSPDSRHLLFSSHRHEDWDFDRAEDVFRVAVDEPGAEPERLTTTGLMYSHPSYSPDGRIALVREDQRVSPSHSQIGVLGEGGHVDFLTTSLDRNCMPYVGGGREPLWDGESIVFGVEDGGNTHLYRVPADGSGTPEPVVSGERFVTGWDAVGGVIAFTSATATSLPELFVVDGAGRERQLTAIAEPFTRRLDGVPEAERFTAVSSDGAEIDAWVIRPVGFEPGKAYPTLLNIHGGPFTQYGNKFFDEFQVQAGAGYVVVYSNPRGSSGYSEAWGRAIRGPGAQPEPGTGWGGVDYDDLMTVMDEAVKRFDFIDRDRLGVLGGSYGGYMTTWIIGHTNRFAAACSERAVNNLLTMEHTSDIATEFDNYVGPRHVDDPDEYRRQSPISHVKSIETPVLILHSEDDLRCPVEQSEELFIALRLLGKPVEYVRFPGESHELTRSGSPRHRIERFEIQLEFFDRYLKR